MTVRFETPEDATPIDAEGLLLDGVFDHAALNAAEAENILQAVNKHLRLRKRREEPWLSEKYLRRVHQDMFDRVWEWAGQFRGVELNLGVCAHQIREEIAKLCQDAAFWDAQGPGGMPAIERAARLHHRLAWIHPFPNGNGRHARMMADIYLHLNGLPLPTWPSAAIGASGDARTDYIQALKKADGGDFALLIEYTRRFLPKEGK